MNSQPCEHLCHCQSYGISLTSNRSHSRAEAAQGAGKFNKEIVPFTVFQKNATTGERSLVTVTQDDGIRYGTTKEGLAKIRSAFPQWGISATTGGNASQITDGAAAVLMVSAFSYSLLLVLFSSSVDDKTESTRTRLAYTRQAYNDCCCRSSTPYHGHWSCLCDSCCIEACWDIPRRCRHL